jgi:hypothetical protein
MRYTLGRPFSSNGGLVRQPAGWESGSAVECGQAP